jgi:hypothetical protein
VAFFYIAFYFISFFIFAGAPDWKRYKGFGRAKTFFFMIVHGFARFGQLTVGVWTDSMGNYKLNEIISNKINEQN